MKTTPPFWFLLFHQHPFSQQKPVFNTIVYGPTLESNSHEAAESVWKLLPVVKSVEATHHVPYYFVRNVLSTWFCSSLAAGCFGNPSPQQATVFITPVVTVAGNYTICVIWTIFPSSGFQAGSSQASLWSGEREAPRSRGKTVEEVSVERKKKMSRKTKPRWGRRSVTQFSFWPGLQMGCPEEEMATHQSNLTRLMWERLARQQGHKDSKNCGEKEGAEAKSSIFVFFFLTRAERSKNLAPTTYPKYQ